MITVHHLNNSRSQRILWMLEELDVPYEIRRYQRDAKTMLAPPGLRAVHPLGKSPVITDGDRTVAESGAILEYLVERYGNGSLKPVPGSAEHDRYRYWLHYAEGSLMPYLVMQLVLSQVPKHVPMLIRPVARAIVGGVDRGFLAPNLKTHFTYLESEAGRHPWFAGSELSAADIQMSFPIEAAEARARRYGFGPNLADFLARVRARPAYQRALEKGGPFSLTGAN